MNEATRTALEIRRLLQRYFDDGAPPFVEGRSPLPLTVPSYGWEEVWEAVDSLLSRRVTIGEKVRRFEEMFAQYIGVRHAVMVNSGSSANLLALSILSNPLAARPLAPGDEVITPAVTWATTVFPIINVGCVPVLVDVDLETFCLDLDQVERAITPRTRAIMPVHLLGNPCDMALLMRIARRHDLLVIEDTCEAHGAEVAGRKAGSFGDVATFSFFFTHHISTIEGGMLVTDDDRLAELARALRAFGWVRDLADREGIASCHPEIDPRFLFVNIGYNFKPTELQAAFGIHQLRKLEEFIDRRRQNHRAWTAALAPYREQVWVHDERPGTRHAGFGYQVTVSPSAPFRRSALVAHLEARGLETRPIVAGNIAEQPAMRLFPHRVSGDLPNSRLIMRQSFYFGNHQGIGERERTAVEHYFSEFLERYHARVPLPLLAGDSAGSNARRAWR
ncbi:MAG: DegT/DnrJ/EryC1/StrS family aminotransferase [Chloroflexi bacterium]|nr:DegT/DnrJ/EryC1/StrS family aminotransferase [Chloroflexota bacterium]